MNIDNFLQSKRFKITIACMAIFIALLLVFSLGVYVGAQKASFSFRWAEQYHRNFAGPAGGFLQEFARPGEQLLESNGIIGKIMQINGQQIVVEGKNNTERIVDVNEKTVIKYQNKDVQISDLKTGEDIIIIGKPNDEGRLEAMLIRVMPADNGRGMKATPSDIPETNQN